MTYFLILIDAQKYNHTFFNDMTLYTHNYFIYLSKNMQIIKVYQGTKS